VALAVEWSPAYEFLISFGCFVFRQWHPVLEIGQAWVKQVRQSLTGAYLERISHKSFLADLKDADHDLLMLLVRACPDASRQDACQFLDWLAALSPGDAYEALAPRLPESGPQLPRDFAVWRDHYVDVLGVWESAYFRTVDAAILDGLRQESHALAARLGSAPALDLVEQVTNGLCVEPTPAVQSITLGPQYHQRPYNTDFLEQGNIVILYPADVLPPDPQLPPPRLLRLTRALGDDSRLRILRFLSGGACSLTEVARFAHQSQPTVHHHLAQLRAAGLVQVQFAPGVPTPNRYCLRPHALEQLAQQLGTYLVEPNRSTEEMRP
jgi:DNA-binding transcriptional ArsR family regulator